jgi:E3 SUMO-protein ligase RanBP2
MRREQVLKVACNHYLTADMVLKPLQTSETSWCWYAVDHTENEPKNEQFALRFKVCDLLINIWHKL